MLLMLQLMIWRADTVVCGWLEGTMDRSDATEKVDVWL